MIFGIKEDNFDSYNVFLAIASNMPQRHTTAFVLQGHRSLLDCHCVSKARWVW